MTVGTRGPKAPLATRHENASGPSRVTAWTDETAHPEGSGGTDPSETTILSVEFLMFCKLHFASVKERNKGVET